MRTSSEYKEKIKELILNVNKEIIDINISRERGTAPTQASSEFLTNKHQGDWAEQTLLNSFNNSSNQYIAVKYGLDIDLVAGDPGFKDFYEKYQDELDTIGKKPDLLIFDKKDYCKDWGFNISSFPEKKLDEIVPKAICGLEVRSSSFLYNDYEKFSKKKHFDKVKEILEIKDDLLNNHYDIIKSNKPNLLDYLTELNESNVTELDFRYVALKKDEEFDYINQSIKKIKENISELKKRDFLSITPKVEDIKVVYNWIQKYGIPHYYIQVFFDCAFGVSFKEILELLNHNEMQNIDYFIEKDVKNQNKTTIKINTRKCVKLMEEISIPEHLSGCKHLGDRGRLMFYVDFKPSHGKIIKNNFNALLGYDLIK